VGLNDFGILQNEIDNFGGIAGAKPLPLYSGIKSKTKKYHKDLKTSDMIKRGYERTSYGWRAGPPQI